MDKCLKFGLTLNVLDGSNELRNKFFKSVKIGILVKMSPYTMNIKILQEMMMVVVDIVNM